MKKRTTKILVSLIIVLSLILNLTSMMVNTADLSKISDALLEKMSNSNDSISVSIWLSSPDIAAEKNALQEAVVTMQENADVATASNEIITIDQTNDLKVNYRNSVSQVYLENNMDFSSSYIDEEDIVFTSKYAPMIIANLTADEIWTLSGRSDVINIDYYEEQELFGNEIETEILTEEMTLAMETLSANYSSYTGAGIKIGVMETSTLREEDLPPNCNFGGATEDVYSTINDNVGHALRVTDILLSIAPDATYYFTGNYTLVFPNIEWLLDQGVDIINMSKHVNTTEVGTSTYDNVTRWFDHVAYNHYVLIVHAVGNVDVTGDYMVDTPAMAYNNIAVGAMNSNYAVYSTYYSGTTLAFKPDICADRESFVMGEAGSSYAAPRVTATAALMMQADAQLKYSPELVKAILTAAVDTNTVAHYIPSIRNASAYTDYMKAGAGYLSTSNALEATVNGQTRCTTMTPSKTSHSYTFNVSSDNVGVLTRVSMAFTVPVTCTGDHETATPIGYTIPNLDLEIYTPNSTTPYVVSATTNNVEIVEFYPTVSGTYTIKVVNTVPSTENVYFGVAWHFD